MAQMRKISIQQIYNEFIKDKLTPRQQFLSLVASLTDSSPGTVAMWLSHYSSPDDDKILSIAEYFDADPEFIFVEQKKKRRKKPTKGNDYASDTNKT